MTNICPNCSRPLRPGAKFCGFCGTDLTATTKGGYVNADTLEGAGTTDSSELKKPPKSGSRDGGKTIAIIAIILLVVVILYALSVQYWATIYPYLNQILPTLFPK